jgi:hypothetical protein
LSALFCELEEGLRCDMTEPRRIDVVLSEGRWLAAMAPYFDREFEGATLVELIEAVQQGSPTESFVFVVERSTLEGNTEAKAQFHEAREMLGVLMISSVQEF